MIPRADQRRVERQLLQYAGEQRCDRKSRDEREPCIGTRRDRSPCVIDGCAEDDRQDDAGKRGLAKVTRLPLQVERVVGERGRERIEEQGGERKPKPDRDDAGSGQISDAPGVPVRE